MDLKERRNAIKNLKQLLNGQTIWVQKNHL